MKYKRVYLIGFMGAGKTTVGMELANVMNVPFIDLDTVLVEQRGLEIAKIFQLHGEGTFRLWEKETLFQFKEKEGIIATGGGIIETLENMTFMQSTGIVVYLKASFETI